MRSREYLQEIRKSEGLQRAVLKNVAVKGKQVTFSLITDLTYSREDVSYAEKVSSRFVPAGFTAKANVFKSVPDGAAVKSAVREILSRRYPAASAFVSEEDVRAEASLGGGHFVIGVSEGEKQRFEEGVLDAIIGELSRSLCGVWTGEIELREKPEYELKEEVAPEEYVLTARYFPITEYSPIDGAEPKQAIYIADLTEETQGITVCGRVTYIEERATKKGKPYFSVVITDGNDQFRATYFSKKATLEKVRSVKAGDYVCLTGDYEVYNGSLTLNVKAMDFGSPPQNFVPEARPSRPVPVRYKKVFPAPASDHVQSNLFVDTSLPADFVKEKFVVFDVETTGKNSGAGGVIDHITEVGAVKIENGRITERFSSFVACPVRLSQEIIELTGITDEMLVGAPAVGDVMADFYKFCDGCALVGHNVQFDAKFIRHYGAEQGYYFNHKLYDTWPMAQRLLRLNNYKLNTIADYYGFTFNHHRAYNDAFVTAKIFIELVRQNKGISNL